ncbi:hypothetical protein [Streptomyces adelaidensis]|uniref:hypothetical protein n=1 Tax=Streptomyces adelaidensis TaxID=2796465 RepID=UPI00190596D6|nr:hypothetical protein [Streptomyces adelaidensis]
MRPDFAAAGRSQGHGPRPAESLIGGTGRLALRTTRRGTTATLSVPLPATAGTTPVTPPAAR